jgi:hypothetical protein
MKIDEGEDQAAPTVGNPNRDIWKAVCYQLASQVSFLKTQKFQANISPKGTIELV